MKFLPFISLITFGVVIAQTYQVEHFKLSDSIEISEKMGDVRKNEVATVCLEVDLSHLEVHDDISDVLLLKVVNFNNETLCESSILSYWTNQTFTCKLPAEKVNPGFNSLYLTIYDPISGTLYGELDASFHSDEVTEEIDPDLQIYSSPPLSLGFSDDSSAENVKINSENNFIDSMQGVRFVKKDLKGMLMVSSALISTFATYMYFAVPPKVEFPETSPRVEKLNDINFISSSDSSIPPPPPPSSFSLPHPPSPPSQSFQSFRPTTSFFSTMSSPSLMSLKGLNSRSFALSSKANIKSIGSPKVNDIIETDTIPKSQLLSKTDQEQSQTLNSLSSLPLQSFRLQTSSLANLRQLRARIGSNVEKYIDGSKNLMKNTIDKFGMAPVVGAVGAVGIGIGVGASMFMNERENKQTQLNLKSFKNLERKNKNPARKNDKENNGDLLRQDRKRMNQNFASRLKNSKNSNRVEKEEKQVNSSSFLNALASVFWIALANVFQQQN